MPANMHIYMPAHMHIYMPANIHVYMPARMHIYMPASMHMPVAYISDPSRYTTIYRYSDYIQTYVNFSKSPLLSHRIILV